MPCGRETSWRWFLTVGIVVAAGHVLLPRGLGRDLVYTLTAAAAVAAIVVGVRRHRPPQPRAWILLTAGLAITVLGSAMYAWFSYRAPAGQVPFVMDLPYLVAYPLFAGGLLVLVGGRGSSDRPNALLDGAILTVGLGLLSWIFLIEPSWTADRGPIFDRLVGVAFPLADVLLFAMLVGFATTAWAPNTASSLLAGSVGALLVTDSLFQAATFAPVIQAHLPLLDLGWLAAHVLVGAAALHPSMRTLSAPLPDRARPLRHRRLLALAATVMIGPAIIVGELILGAPLHVWATVIASVPLVLLVLVRILRLVRQLESQAEQLGRLADTDFVTGLANERRFSDRVGSLTSGGHGEVAVLLLIDLERFAEINDTLGHRTGDAMLRAVGERLRELTGDHALVARMGDHAFGVLDPAVTTGHDADDAATRIRSALERPLDLRQLTVSVEASIGVLLLTGDGLEPTLALHRAEVALSAAKVQPSRTARYGAEMETGGTLAPLLIGELRGALEHGEIVLHYQPKVEIDSGRVLGVEALARWQHPRHGLLGPDAFIPAAERTGLIGPFTHYVLDRALRQCAGWRNSGLDLTVAVNLSVLNLLDPNLVDDVRAALARYCLPAGALELEITESSAMVDPRRSVQVLGTLAELGVTLSIDDYGTGHSSLTYLQRLPVKRLKIDRSFVAGILVDDASAAIVHSTIELARHLQLDVIAEGVEDDTTLLALHAMHCHAAQGFGLGHPVAAPLIPALVQCIEDRLPPLLAGLRLGTALAHR